jgi:Na+-driven multidrug efflux pump
MGAPARPIEAAATSGSLKREFGATLSLAWPIILANLTISVMTATDFMMLGRLSPHALAAGSLGFFLYQPLFLFGLGVVGALSPIAAAKIGAGQGDKGLRRATHQALIFAVVFAVAVWIALIGASPFLLAIGEPGDVVRTLRFISEDSNGAWRPAWCTMRRGPRFRRLSGRARRSSRDLWPSRSTPSPIMR